MSGPEQTDSKSVRVEDGNGSVVVRARSPMNTFIESCLNPVAVIDHHRTKGHNPKCEFCDIRTDVGSTTSIIFSYFLELQVTIPAGLAAAMLYAIETDLAGAAGTPGELNNIALSNLTLIADTRELYQMRYVDLPQSFYIATAAGLTNAMYYDYAIISHLDAIDSP